MRTETCLVSGTIHERLLPVLVVLRVGKLRGVVHDLVHDLWDTHGVGGRTLVSREVGVAGIGDVAMMIGRVDVLAVPAGWEDVRDADTARTRLGRELGRVGAVAGGAVAARGALGFGQAAVAVDEGTGSLRTKGGITSNHAEALGECGSFLVATTEGPHVVDGETAVLLEEGAIEAAVGHLWDATECAVFGRLEVDRGGPVVAEVLDHLARSALGCRSRVDRGGVHLIR